MQGYPTSAIKADENASGSVGPPILFDLTGKRTYVAGHAGMVGQAIVRRLRQENVAVLTSDRRLLDLTRQQSVERWLGAEKPMLLSLRQRKSAA